MGMGVATVIAVAVIGSLMLGARYLAGLPANLLAGLCWLAPTRRTARRVLLLVEDGSSGCMRYSLCRSSTRSRYDGRS